MQHTRFAVVVLCGIMILSVPGVVATDPATSDAQYTTDSTREHNFISSQSHLEVLEDIYDQLDNQSEFAFIYEEIRFKHEEKDDINIYGAGDDPGTRSPRNQEEITFGPGDTLYVAIGTNTGVDSISLNHRESGYLSDDIEISSDYTYTRGVSTDKTDKIGLVEFEVSYTELYENLDELPDELNLVATSKGTYALVPGTGSDETRELSGFPVSDEPPTDNSTEDTGPPEDDETLQEPPIDSNDGGNEESSLTGAEFDGCKQFEVNGTFGENHTTYPYFSYFREQGYQVTWPLLNFSSMDVELPYTGTINYTIKPKSEVTEEVDVNEGEDEINIELSEGGLNGRALVSVYVGAKEGTSVDPESANVFNNPNDCRAEIQPDRPTVTVNEVNNISGDTYEVTFITENPNNGNMRVDSEFTSGTVNTDAISGTVNIDAPSILKSGKKVFTLNPGEESFTVEWTPESEDEQLVYEGNLSDYDYDEPLTAETQPASEYGATLENNATPQEEPTTPQEEPTTPQEEPTTPQEEPTTPQEESALSADIAEITPVEQGETLDIPLDLTNEGDTVLDAQVSLFDADPRSSNALDSQSIQLPPGETDRVTLSIDTTFVEPDQDNTYQIRGGDYSDGPTHSILEQIDIGRYVEEDDPETSESPDTESESSTPSSNSSNNDENNGQSGTSEGTGEGTSETTESTSEIGNPNESAENNEEDEEYTADNPRYPVPESDEFDTSLPQPREVVGDEGQANSSEPNDIEADSSSSEGNTGTEPETQEEEEASEGAGPGQSSEETTNTESDSSSPPAPPAPPAPTNDESSRETTDGGSASDSSTPPEPPVSVDDESSTSEENRSTTS